MQTFAWYKGKPINYDLENVPRTQDMEPVFVETSAYFIFKKEIWTKYGRRIGFNPYIQEVGEIESVDIDTMEDLRFAQILADNVLHV
jgi:CMP-N-acetylneuraminic acid synthetase